MVATSVRSLAGVARGDGKTKKQLLRERSALTVAESIGEISSRSFGLGAGRPSEEHAGVADASRGSVIVKKFAI